MKRCPQCGREYPAEYEFCQEDAAQLIVVAAADPPAHMPPITKAAPPRGIIIGLVGMLFLVGTIAGWKVLTHPHPVETIPDTAQQDTHGRKEAPPSDSPDPKAVAEAEGETTDGETSTGTSGAAWKTYKNVELGVQFEYPAAWTVQVTHYPGRQRVQFTGGPDVSVGLDVSPSHDRSLAEWKGKHPGQWIWGDLETGFLKRKNLRYHREKLETYELNDQPAMSWEFTIQPEGKPTVRKWDVGTLCHGRGYAMICEAPDGQFSQERASFEHMTATMKFQVDTSSENQPATLNGVDHAPARGSSGLTPKVEPQPESAIASAEQAGKESGTEVQPNLPGALADWIDLSSTRLLTQADLTGRSALELSLMRNGPYARHGYRFHTADIAAYFKKQTWYHPTTGDMDKVSKALSEVERRNTALILSYVKNNNMSHRH